MEQVVLLPGLMCDERLFEPLTIPLKKNYRVHSLLMDSHNCMDEMADFVLNLIRGPFHAIGLSMGGIIAMTVAIKDPSRLNSLVLMDKHPATDSARKRAVRDAQMKTVKNSSDLQRVLAQELKPNYVHDENANKHILDLCMKMALDLGHEIFINQCLALRNRHSLIGSLSSIDCKTLVLCGEHDKLCTVKVHQDMVKHISNSKLSIIPNCGHLPILEKPEVSTKKIMSFLNGDWDECRV